jgi:hypothetical protein
VRQYSADLIEVTWAVVNAVPLDLKEGLAQGTFIQPTRSAPTWNMRPNGVGGIVRLFDPNQSGTLAMLIDMESRTHQELITLANLDAITRTITGPIVVRDGNTREVSFYNKAFLAAIPDIPKGVTSGVVAWQWLYERSEQQPFGFNNNAVGG